MDRDNKNRFKATVCKKYEDGLLRIFELPFNSGEATSCTIRITVSNMTAWIYPGKDPQAYAALPDVDYEQWRQDELHQVTRIVNDIGGTLGDTLNGIGEFVGGVGDKISKAVTDVICPGTKEEETAEENDADTAEEDKAEAKEEAAENTEDKKNE